MRQKLYLSILILLLTATSYAQWKPDARLTTDTAISFTSYNNARCIAAGEKSVHVVWYDYRDGNAEIYYKRSTDEGMNWSTGTRLTNDTSDSKLPSIIVSGLLVHVVWEEYRDGNSEIYYKRSTDGGTTWGADIRLTNDFALSELPSISVSGLALHVVWNDYRDTNYEIYYKRSTDGGITWEADMQLTSDPANSVYPAIAVSDSVVHAVWFDDRDGNDEIYYKRSTDGGKNWEADTRLTNSSYLSWVPSVSVSNSDVHVVWTDDRDGNDETYYKRSTDGGITWEQDTRLTNNSANSWNPSISVAGKFLHLVWWDDRDGNAEIYYKQSTDSGLNWGMDTRLSNAPDFSNRPSISVSDSVLHVVWRDFRDQNWEIYYKRFSSGNMTSVKNPVSELPEGYKLEQNYPNPFNPSTKISFRISYPGFVSLKVYDVLGKEVATLVNEEKPSGEFEVEFVAGRLSSGIYFYKLQSGNFSQTKKMLLLK